MKYIYINLKNFMYHEKTVFALMLLCIFYSVMVVCFTFGFYHHLEQKKLDAMVNTKYLSIHFVGDDRVNVKKDDLLNIIKQFSEKTLQDCRITMGGRFVYDMTKDSTINNSTLVFPMQFMVDNGKIVAIPMESELKECNALVEGRYFTDQEISDGELVCVAMIPPDEWGTAEQNLWQEKYNANQDGTYTIDGKTYTCIGKLGNGYGSVIPWIPVTTVNNDNCYIQQLYLEYENAITRAAYTEITEAIRHAYGDTAEIPEFDLPEVDSMRFYNTLLILCILLIGMSGVVVAVLYQYIMLQRRKQLTIYRLCGMAKKKACQIYFLECFIISVVIFVISVCVFHFGLLPILSRTFEYISASYSLYTYGMLGGLYIGIISLILYMMIRYQIGNNVCSELREV